MRSQYLEDARDGGGGKGHEFRARRHGGEIFSGVSVGRACVNDVECLEEWEANDELIDAARTSSIRLSRRSYINTFALKIGSINPTR